MTQPFPSDTFTDVLAANREYAATFSGQELTGTARRGLAIITCMDSRINPLAIVGMQPGDVKILRNAGARVTDDVLRTLVLATHLLGVTRVLVMPHTNRKMASATEDQIHEALLEASGMDTRSLDIAVVEDQIASLRKDITRIESLPYLPSDLVVGGAIYDVFTGELRPIDA